AMSTSSTTVTARKGLGKAVTYCDLLWSLQIASSHEGLGQSSPVSIMCGSGTVKAIFSSETIPCYQDSGCRVNERAAREIRGYQDRSLERNVTYRCTHPCQRESVNRHVILIGSSVI